MATTADITQRDRDAAALAVYECILAAAVELAHHVEELQTEACWVGPAPEAWMAWRQKRKPVEGPKREPDQTS